MNKPVFTSLLLALSIIAQAQPSNVIWNPVGGGVNGPVISVLKGGGDTLVVIGEFTEAGGVQANNVALWDGAAFHALGNGVSGNITTGAIVGQDIYIGGSSLNTNYTDVAKWDGTAWSYSTAFDGNFPQIATMFAHNDTLYAGGIVSGFLGSDDRVKRLDNGGWELVGSTLNNIIHTLGWHNGQIVVGGEFTALQNGGGTNLNHVAILNGGEWGPLAAGLPSKVNALLDVDGTLYAAGDILNGGNTQFGLARFPEDATAWEDLMPGATSYVNTGSGVDASIFALDHDGSNLFIGGDFDLESGSLTGSYVARFDGVPDAFIPYATFNASVSALAHNATLGLVAGGLFTQNGATAVDHLGHADISTAIGSTNSSLPLFELFPNPATDRLSISLIHDAAISATVELLTLDGRVLVGPMDLSDGKATFDVSKLADGPYLVRISGVNGLRSVPFMKQ
ncbi:MAG: T9SS type A sorting domain-containing protein [Flavobacteriales bacterium]